MARITKAEKQRRQEKLRETGGIILFGLALFSAAIIWLPDQLTGQFGLVIKQMAFGLFGTIGNLLPLIFIYLALELLLAKEVLISRKRQVLSLCLILTLICLIAVFSLREDSLIKHAMGQGKVEASKVLKYLWTASNPGQIANHSDFWNGGLIGSVIGLGLLSLFGKIGAVLLIMIALLVILLFLFNFSYVYLVRTSYVNLQEKHRSYLEAREAARERRRQELEERSRNLDNIGNSAFKDSFSGQRNQDSTHETDSYQNPSQPEDSFYNSDRLFEQAQADGGDNRFTGSGSESATSNLPWLQEPESELRSEQDEIQHEVHYSLPPGDWRLANDSPDGPRLIKSVTSAGKQETISQTDWLELGEKIIEDDHLSTDSQLDQALEEPRLEEGESLEPDLEELKPEQNTDQPDQDPEILARAQEIEALKESLQAEDSRETWLDRSDELANKAHKSGLREVYKTPPLKLLQVQTKVEQSPEQEEEIRLLGATLEKTLNNFGVDAKVVNYTSGPTISRFEIVPGPGIKVSKIVNLADDIALALAATAVRIEAPIPGKSAVGIEIPNKQTTAVLLRGILEDKSFREAKAPLLAALGRDIQGEPILCDLAKMPHLLIAGATGSGKSVCINSILISLLYRSGPENLRLLMIDPKVVELSVYNGIPHLLQPVVTDPKKATGVLRWAVDEMSRRYNLFANAGVRDFHSFNVWVNEGNTFTDPKLTAQKLPYIVLVIDELSDLMATSANEVEESISRLTAMARAAGIHLIIATQRPSVDVITGVIKANIPSRIAFAVASQVDSRTILDLAGAEKLLGKGDMIYAPQSSAKSLRGQGSFVTDREVEAVVSYLKKSYGEDYDESVGLAIDKANPANSGAGSGSGTDSDDFDELLADAMQICLDNKYASISLLQRRLNVGYPRAARMIDQLHDVGAIGPFEGSKPRNIVVKDMEEFRSKLDGLNLN